MLALTKLTCELVGDVCDAIYHARIAPIEMDGLRRRADELLGKIDIWIMDSMPNGSDTDPANE